MNGLIGGAEKGELLTYSGYDLCAKMLFVWGPIALPAFDVGLALAWIV